MSTAPTDSATHAMEYVGKYVVKCIAYRDYEIVQRDKKIQQLEQDLQNTLNTLEELGFVRCNVCQTVVHNYHTCEMCSAKKCETCEDIIHISSWNLSGMNMCFICRNSYCNHCLKQNVLGIDRYCVECQEFGENKTDTETTEMETTETKNDSEGGKVE